MKCRLSVLALLAFLNVSTLCLCQEATASASARFQIPASDDGLPGAGPIRRYDWFRNLWAERRAAWAQRVQQDQRAVVFLGDSITQGWGDNMGNSFPGMKVANRGISGDTTRGVLSLKSAVSGAAAYIWPCSCMSGGMDFLVGAHD